MKPTAYRRFFVGRGKLCALSRDIRYILHGIAGLSATAFCALIAWRLLLPPLTYRNSCWVGNTVFLNGQPVPSSWFGTHQSYDLPIFDSEFPYWLAIFLTSLWPIIWLGCRIQSGRNAQDKSGLCQSCSYDLRATPDRCPECGTIPNNSK